MEEGCRRQARRDSRFGRSANQIDEKIDKIIDDAATEVDPAKQQAATDALAEAEISRKLCEARGCSATDLEAWLRARQSHAAAKSAVADGQPVVG